MHLSAVIIVVIEMDYVRHIHRHHVYRDALLAWVFSLEQRMIHGHD